MFFLSAHCIMCPSLPYRLGGYVFLVSFHAFFLACQLLLFPLLTSLAKVPALFRAPVFLASYIYLIHSPITSSVVCDLNAGCRAVTSSCTALPTLLLFTATATHLHPSGCQYCYHYTPVLSVLHGQITLYIEGNMVIGNLRSQASQNALLLTEDLSPLSSYCFMIVIMLIVTGGTVP